MKNLLISAAAVVATAICNPTPSSAQIGFGIPGFGVQIGGGPYYGGYGYGDWGYGRGPYYGGYGAPYYGSYRSYEYDEPVVVQRRVYSNYDEPIVRRRSYRERPVSMRACRIVSVQRPNGTFKNVRRCG